ncbi:MAG: HAD-IIB family hydrolase [Ruminococcaceae bacterium]|nr:HAD-IIB family hydrolase [Oscillospiraceae bacterium]
MLKLVVSDLDGTLINGHNSLPDNVIEMIKTLRKNGIFFAVASGRKVCELGKIFEKVKNDVIFVACDGTFIMYNREVLHKEVIDKKIIDSCFKRFGIDAEYISDSFGDTVKIVVKKSDLTVRAEEVIRINRDLSCVYEDDDIKEYVKFGRNKGTALKELMRILKIDKKDVVAFGDNINDIEMLKLIPKSYAMESGKPQIKRICKYTTADVCQSVYRILENQGGFING